MARKRIQPPPDEMELPIEEKESSELPPQSRDDHNPRTSPAMRDGNSSHGNPSETAIDDLTSDNDSGDAEEASEPPYSGHSGGAVGGTPAEKRSSERPGGKRPARKRKG